MTVLKPGDLVVLKSGGPVMTVDTVNTDIFDDDKITGILCAWFVGDKLQRARFDSGAIVPAPLQDAPFQDMPLQDMASETTEARPQEIIGEYKAVLDEMAAAMNDVVEATDDASRAPVGRPKRASQRKYEADTVAPVQRGAN
jgi:uncharacterized protein YodC (DUF2158 family)